MTKRRKVKVGTRFFRTWDGIWGIPSHTWEGAGEGHFHFFCCFSSYTITKKVKSKSLWVSEAWSWQKNIAKPEHSGRIWLCHCSRMCRLAIIQIIMRIRVMMLSADPGSRDARHFFSENEFHAKNGGKWQSMKEYSANMTEKSQKMAKFFAFFQALGDRHLIFCIPGYCTFCHEANLPRDRQCKCHTPSPSSRFL